MPRGPRLDAPGVLHHVMVRGIERAVLFLDRRDRDELVRRLAAVMSAGKASVFAWALLPNHGEWTRPFFRCRGKILLCPWAWA